jgi:DNA-directed RNA polymerase subunit RPC12/RpoP
MSIQFCCTQCQQPIEVDAEHAGKSAVCPYCRHMVAVPADSTYRHDDAVAARPLDTPAEAASEPASVDAGQPPTASRAPAIPPPRLRTGYTFGSYALLCTGLGVVLFAAAMIGSAGLFWQKFGQGTTTAPSPEEMEQHLRAVTTEHAWIPALELGGLFFGLAGLALGIVSLTQVRANWRGLTAVIVCAVFLLCVCSATGLAVMMGLGVPR